MVVKYFFHYGLQLLSASTYEVRRGLEYSERGNQTYGNTQLYVNYNITTLSLIRFKIQILLLVSATNVDIYDHFLVIKCTATRYIIISPLIHT